MENVVNGITDKIEILAKGMLELGKDMAKEDKINQLVYQLYGLSEEEIEIIENG